MARVFLLSELGDRSPARAALATGPWTLSARLLRGTFLDCPIGLPPDLAVVEPGPLRSPEPVASALAAHPVVGRTPWLLVVDPERVHLTPALPCADFVLRGFAASELAVRAERVLGSRTRHAAVVHSGPLTLDLAAHTAKVGDLQMAVKPQEFALLRYLVQFAGRPLTRDQLLRAVWGPNYTGGERTVDVHIRRLRVHLGPAAGLLETLREVGYRWAP